MFCSFQDQTQEDAEKKSLTVQVHSQQDEEDELSPGFSDIPLPDDVIIPPEETVVPPEFPSVEIPDFPPPPQPDEIEIDDIIKQEQSEPNVHVISQDLDNASEAARVIDASLVCDLNAESRPQMDAAGENSNTTVIATESTENRDVIAPDEFPPPVAELPVAITPLPEEGEPGVMPHPEVLSTTPDELPPIPDEISPNNEELPTPPDVLTPDVNIIPPDGQTESTPAYSDVTNLSPGHQSRGGDTSDGEFLSDDDILLEESYLQGTRVDDFMSPVAKSSPAADAKRKASLPPPVEEEELSLVAQNSASSQSYLKVSELDEARPGSSLSTASSDRGSRSYHSDDIPDDASNQKQLDHGAHTSVSALKTYFQSEIDKVTKHPPGKSSTK